MAEAIIRGMLSAHVVAPSRIRVAEPLQARREFLQEALGIHIFSDNREAVVEADTVIMAVKPQLMRQVLEGLNGLEANRLWVSIAAGIPLTQLDAWLGAGSSRWIRVMPNTPALCRAGAAVFSPGPQATTGDRECVRQLLDPSGMVLELPESLLDAVTALSGSGPAYVFLLAEAMAKAGQALGLPAEAALALARQTVYGAGQLMFQSEDPPSTLRERVTSKGGTTAAALAAFADGDFDGLVHRAMQAAASRSRELSENA